MLYSIESNASKISFRATCLELYGWEKHVVAAKVLQTCGKGFAN